MSSVLISLLSLVQYESDSVCVLTHKVINYRICTQLEVVPRYRDPQLQAGKNYLHLYNLNQENGNLTI